MFNECAVGGLGHVQRAFRRGGLWLRPFVNAGQVDELLFDADGSPLHVDVLATQAGDLAEPKAHCQGERDGSVIPVRPARRQNLVHFLLGERNDLGLPGRLRLRHLQRRIGRNQAFLNSEVQGRDQGRPDMLLRPHSRSVGCDLFHQVPNIPDRQPREANVAPSTDDPVFDDVAVNGLRVPSPTRLTRFEPFVQPLRQRVRALDNLGRSGLFDQAVSNRDQVGLLLGASRDALRLAIRPDDRDLESPAASKAEQGPGAVRLFSCHRSLSVRFPGEWERVPNVARLRPCVSAQVLARDVAFSEQIGDPVDLHSEDRSPCCGVPRSIVFRKLTVDTAQRVCTLHLSHLSTGVDNGAADSGDRCYQHLSPFSVLWSVAGPPSERDGNASWGITEAAARESGASTRARQSARKQNPLGRDNNPRA